MRNRLPERRALGIITSTLIIMAVVAGLGTAAMLFYQGKMGFFKTSVSTLYSTNLDRAQESLKIENVGYYQKTQSFNLTMDNLGYEGIAIQNVTLTNSSNQIIKANTTSVSSPGTSNSGSGSIALDATSSFAIGQVSSYTYTHTVGAGLSNSILVVGVSVPKQNGITVSSIKDTTDNNAALSKAIAFSGGGGIRAEIWYLTNPPSGANSIKITFSGTISSDGATVGTVSLSGVDQNNPIGTTATGGATSGNPSASITTINDNAWLIDTVAYDQQNYAATPGSGQTQQWQLNGGASVGMEGFGSTKPTNTHGSNSMSWTVAGSNNWGMVVAEIKPASGGSGGGSSSLTLDGSANNKFSSTNSNSGNPLTLTTTKSNDIIIVEVVNENSGGAIVTVSSVTASGLTFTKRSSSSVNSNPFSDVEVWYAIATSPLSSEVITVTLSGNTDDASIIAFGVSGANTASPWDTNPSLPKIATGSGATTPSVSGASTSNANDVILGFGGIGEISSNSNIETAGSGFSLIGTPLLNTGAIGSSQAAVQYEKVSATQSSITIAFGTVEDSNSQWIMIGDAIQPALGSSGSSSLPLIQGSVCAMLPGQSCTVSLGYHGFIFPVSISVTTSRGNVFTTPLSPFVPWYDDQFQYRKQITIKTSQVAGTLYNFTALVSMTDTDLKNNAQADGSDIAFTSSDGVTPLNFEIENYTSSTGTLTAWVKIPVLYNTPQNIIYMYYGSANACSLQNPTGTWDSNYAAVYHFKENPASITSPVQVNSVQSIAAVTDSSGNAQMQTFAVGPGNYRVLIVGAIEDGNDVTSVTYGSQSLTRYVNYAPSTVHGSIWYLINPLCHAATITTTSQGAAKNIVIGAYSIYGADQTNPLYSSNTNSGNSGTASVSITNLHTNSWVLDVAGVANGNGLNSPTQKQEWATTASTISSASSMAGPLPSHTPTTFQWSVTSGAWIDMAVEVQAPFVPTLSIDGTVQTAITNADVSSWTISNFAIGNNINRLLLVGVEVDDGQQVSSVTYGGIPLNLVVTSTPDSVDVEFWDLVNPPVGTANLVVNTNGNSPLGIGAYSLYGVDQTTPTPKTAVATLGQSCNSNPCTSVSITNTYKGSWVVDNSGIFDNNGMSNPSKTQQWVLGVDSGSLELYDASSKAGPLAANTNTKFTWNDVQPSNSGWDAVAVEIKNSSSLTVAPVIHDSTSNANNLSPYNMLATDQIPGQIDGSLNFRATNYAADTSNPSGLPNPNTPLTLSAWFWVSSNPSDTHDILTLQSSSTNFLKMGFKTSSSFAVWNNNNNLVSTTTLPTAGGWHYAVYAFDGTTHRLYIDGLQVNSCANSSCPFQSFTPNAVYAGTNSGITELYNGHLDEIRISTIARSAVWITTEYNNQASPSTFFTEGPPQYVLDARATK